MKSINFLKSGLIMLVMIMVISCQNDIDEIVENDEKCVDIDGNIYNTIKIGDQVWMTEVLKTTKYRNGDPIATTDSLSSRITNEIKPKYYWYYQYSKDDFANSECTYYTWYAMTDERQIAPVGWHVPNKDEWESFYFHILNNPNDYEHLSYGYRCAYSSNLYNPSFDKTFYATSSEYDENKFYIISITLNNRLRETYYVEKNFGLPVICVKDKE